MLAPVGDWKRIEVIVCTFSLQVSFLAEFFYLLCEL